MSSINMMKVAGLHQMIIEPMDAMKRRLSDIIEAHELKGGFSKEPSEADQERMEKALGHLGKVVDEFIVELEKNLRRYYAMTDQGIFKPAPPVKPATPPPPPNRYDA